MEDIYKHNAIDYTGEEGGEATQSTIEQHVLHKSSRRRREVDGDQERLANIARLNTSYAMLNTPSEPSSPAANAIEVRPIKQTLSEIPEPRSSTQNRRSTLSWINSQFEDLVAMNLDETKMQRDKDEVAGGMLRQATMPSRPLVVSQGLPNYLLECKISRLRYWLLGQSKSEHFSRFLQRQVRYRQLNSSTPQDQSTTSSSRSTSDSSASSPSTSSSVPTTLSGATSSGSKRTRDEAGENDRQPDRKRRVPRDKEKSTPTPRLACFYNKHDPMVYRLNAQTCMKFQICENHDWQDMGKLYEHLKRVHSDQPLQCPRCTQGGFRTSGELELHQTALEPCILVSPSAVKRIKWLSQDERLALQAKVNRESADLRRLGACTEEDKWKIAYRCLFPDTESTPSPYLQDPVISTVSFVIDSYDARLRDLIRQSIDLSDFESRMPIILPQFLAQYGITIKRRLPDPPHQAQVQVLSSSPSIIGPSSEVESNPLPAFDLSSAFNDNSRLEHSDFVAAAGDMLDGWDPYHDGSYVVDVDDHMFEKDLIDDPFDCIYRWQDPPGSKFTDQS